MYDQLVDMLKNKGFLDDAQQNIEKDQNIILSFTIFS